MKRAIGVIVALALVGLGMYVVRGRSGKQTAPPKKQPLVTVAPVTLGNIAESLSVTGKVEPVISIDVVPKVEQRIVWMPLREGDRVQAGQVVARLDPTELSRQLDQARAEERVAAASLRDVLAGSRREEVAQARALLRQAQATQAKAEASLRNSRSLYTQRNLPQQAADEAEGKVSVSEAQLRSAEASEEDARRDTDRIRHIVQIGGAAQEDLDRAETRLKTVQAQRHSAEAALKAAKAALEHVRELYAGPLASRDLDDAQGRVAESQAGVAAATQKLEMLLAGATPTQAALAREKVAQARTRVASARTVLEYCTLRSPLAGVVVSRHLQVGDMAEPKAPILTIAGTAQMVVRASLPDRDAVRIRRGATALVSLDAHAGRPLRLRVARVYPAADANSRLVTVELALPPGRATAPMGSLARLTIPLAQHQHTVVIPSVAIQQYADGRRVVFVVGDGDTAELREVEAGIEQNDRTEVLSGVKVGERLVVRGQEMLRDGMAVKVMAGKPGKGKKAAGGQGPEDGATAPSRGAGVREAGR